MTNLRNRGLAFAFTSSPALISAFAGSKAASDLLAHSTWRWGFGMWAIILPVVALPIYGLLAYHLRQAEKKGVLVKETRDWSITPKTVWWAIMEFDRKYQPRAVVASKGFLTEG